MAGDSDPEKRNSNRDALGEISALDERSADERSPLTADAGDNDQKKDNQVEKKTGVLLRLKRLFKSDKKPTEANTKPGKIPVSVVKPVKLVAPGFFDVDFEEYLKVGLSPTQVQQFQQKVLQAAETTIKMKAKNESAAFNSSKGFPTLGVSIGFFTATLTVLKGIIDSGPAGVGTYYMFLLVLLGWMISLQIAAVVLTILTMVLTHHSKRDAEQSYVSGFLSAISVILVFSQAAVTAFEVNNLQFGTSINQTTCTPDVQRASISVPIPDY